MQVNILCRLPIKRLIVFPVIFFTNKRVFSKILIILIVTWSKLRKTLKLKGFSYKKSDLSSTQHLQTSSKKLELLWAKERQPTQDVKARQRESNREEFWVTLPKNLTVLRSIELLWECQSVNSTSPTPYHQPRPFWFYLKRFRCVA